MPKYEKGQSGNPRGRPRGVQTQAKLRESIAKDLPGIITSLVKEAKGGDTAAAKLLLDRVLPSLRPVDQPTPMPLSKDIGQAGRDVLAALGEGTVGPDAGAKILQSVGVLARVIETEELSKRIEALEKSLEQRR
jgi:hypothetical protein